ncbi:MAG: ATP-dependent sacrificial sulfur transferase LarE [Deltaproteobacteria bacterium]|nr:MAG: ATP-dependent sacrificial sulfur transferase LarE [Deltaproteobacteria bacterium]
MYSEKLQKLISYLRGLNSLIIAFSGGIDSTFLLYIAREHIKRLILFTSVSAIHKSRDIEDARLIAQDLGIEHITIDTKELLIPEFIINDKNRCYYCKRNLFKNMSKIAREIGISYIAHGVNSDDMQDYRPGHRAAKEYGVLAPLVYAGLKKQEIRRAAMEMGIKIWDKPSSPCLATRIPYGQRITLDKLEMIDRAEALLQDMGYKEVRVRHYGDMAKIEVPESEIEGVIKVRDEILKGFRQIGFLYVTLDIEGFISGKLNRIIEGGN